ncbi:MAG: tyrosine-type recombinase/integrase [Chloroflexi bacterium]|nr:tyrosine-type recombinase/integrase [Chloroflexota bacterium]
MRGSVSKVSDGNWQFVVDVPRSGGARRQMRRRGFRTKKAAEDTLLEVLRATDQYHVGRGDQTVEGFSVGWLPTLVDVEADTRAEHERELRLRIIPHIGGHKMADVTAHLVEEMYGRLGVSPYVVYRTHSTLRRMFRDAVRWRVIATSPIPDARRPKIRRVEHPTFSADELSTVLAALEGDRWSALWRLASMSGMRRGELVGLRWGDVDFEGASVHVRRTVRKSGEVAEPKSQTGARRISLDSITVDALRVWRRRVMTEAAEYPGRSWEPDGWIWAWEDGGRVRPGYVTQAWVRIRRRLGLPDGVRLHDLRHGYATMALQRGVHPRVVQQRLGHSSVSTTLDVYSHVVEGMDRAAADLIGDAVDGDHIVTTPETRTTPDRDR